ncbi:MAG: hypothetical protein ACTHQM_08225 [Thermoanaerobaculia bacterium]
MAAYNRAGPVQGRYIMNFDSKDFALRALIVIAGGLSAVLLALKGYGQALPAVAVGGALGAFFASRVQPASETERD